MAKYIINKGYGNEESVEAYEFRIGEYWATFLENSGELVYAVRYSEVQTIEKEGVTS